MAQANLHGLNDYCITSLQTFFDGWLSRQESLIQQILPLSQGNDASEDKIESLKTLIEQVQAHYEEYYGEKTKLANEDAFLMFCLPWLSSFERSLLWVAGFNPSMILRMVHNAVKDLTEDQRIQLEQVGFLTAREERELSHALARVQESVASPPFSEMARRAGREMDGEISHKDSAMAALKWAMLAVCESADGVRVSTVKGIMDILNPVQSVRFLSTAILFQLRFRRWGEQRDSTGNCRDRC